MISRIGTFGHQQALIELFKLNQTRVGESQRQVASGKVANEFRGLSRQAVSLVSFKSLREQALALQDSNTALNVKLAANETTLAAIDDVTKELNELVLNAAGLKKADGLVNAIGNLVERVAGLLNTRVGGKFIFAGSNTTQAPSAVTNPTELLAVAEPPAGNFFTNNTIKAQARIDENVTITYGVLASDVGQDVLHVMQRILMFNAGTLPAGAGAFAPAGPFSDPLTDAQSDFLVNETKQIKTAQRTLTDAEAGNGVLMKQVQDATDRQADKVIFLSEFIKDTEDVDLPTAVAELNQHQTALQASFQILARISRLNLTDFL